MKKAAILFVTTILVILSTSNAFAKKLDPSLGPYMTDEDSTVKKDIFGWDEKPFAFIQFDVDNLNTKKPLRIWWKWRYDDEKQPVSFEKERITNFPEDPLNIWNSLDNWDTHKKVGEWNVRVSWWNPKGGVGSGKINFTVTPEPVSSVLFLIGGVSLAAFGYRRRKKS